ncbi:MAG: GNAT family N-acetyltransferase [Pseudomonadota bacterium]
MSSTALLRAGEQTELDTFLAAHANGSMYLRAALHNGAALNNFAVAREAGRIVGAAGQLSSGMIALQTATDAAVLVRTVLQASSRPLAGFLGPYAQVMAARRDMALAASDFIKDTHEDLFALNLELLRLPALLQASPLACRLARRDESAQLVAWRAAFRREALHDVEGEGLLAASRADIAGLQIAGNLFVLEVQKQLVACCSFNARLPEIVQIGNVWTPSALRGKGYGRAVVAGALALARRGAVQQAVLSTGCHNLAAQAAYRAIGFVRVGDYASAILSPLPRRKAY